MFSKNVLNKSVAFLLALVICLVPLSNTQVFANDLNYISYVQEHKIGPFNDEYIGTDTYATPRGPRPFATLLAAATRMIGGTPTLVAGTTTKFSSVVNGVKRTVEFSGTSGIVEAVSGTITWIVNILGK